jgi:HlyD family secretion protein
MKFGTVARVVVVLLLVIVAVGALWMRGKGKNDAMVSELTFEAVGRRTLVVSIEATGTVEPINLVEVKSKASGQIIRMPVEVGSRVRPGDLLVQIDTLDVGNAYRQAAAALVAARVQAEVAEAQRARAEQLYAALTITAPEHESALLTYANAQSSLVRATTELANARLRMEDATVRAPIAGTVLEKPVSVGQMIASATSSVSGGTTILKMADLRLIRVRSSSTPVLHGRSPACLNLIWKKHRGTGAVFCLMRALDSALPQRPMVSKPQRLQRFVSRFWTAQRRSL